MDDDYDEKFELDDRKYDLLGIRFDWRFRKTATDGLNEEFQLDLERHLEALAYCPTLSEGVADAAKALDGQAASKDIRKQETSREGHNDIVDDLKRSNLPPTSGQALLLRSDLEIRNSELLSIDHDILRLQLKINESVATMQALLQGRLQKQEEATYRQFWLSSARLLPVDILIKIFKYAKSSRACSRSSALQLSHVCSSWRHAVATCSSLWNDVALDLLSPTDNDRIPFSSLLSFWFGRANPSLPLSLDVSIKTDINAEVGDDVFRGVQPFVSRLGNVQVTIRKPVWSECSNALTSLSPFLERPGGSLSALSHLCLIDNTEGSAERRFPKITVFDQSPLLRTVILHLNPAIYGHQDRLWLPWSQLTCLVIGGSITVRGFVNIIFQCRQLCTAVFYYLNFETSDNNIVMFPIPEAPITFPALKDFRLRLSRSSRQPLIVRHIFSKIHLPVLQYIKLLGGTYSFRDQLDITIPLSDILSLPSDKYLSLHHLSLMNVAFDLEDLLSLLNTVPMLETLSLGTPFRPHSLLEALTQTEGLLNAHTVPSLPNLVSFRFMFNAFKIHENPDIDLVSSAFGSLVASWAGVLAH